MLTHIKTLDHFIFIVTTLLLQLDLELAYFLLWGNTRRIREFCFQDFLCSLLLFSFPSIQHTGSVLFLESASFLSYGKQGLNSLILWMCPQNCLHLAIWNSIYFNEIKFVKISYDGNSLMDSKCC